MNLSLLRSNSLKFQPQVSNNFVNVSTQPWHLRHLYSYFSVFTALAILVTFALDAWRNYIWNQVESCPRPYVLYKIRILLIGPKSLSVMYGNNLWNSYMMFRWLILWRGWCWMSGGWARSEMDACVASVIQPSHPMNSARAPSSTRYTLNSLTMPHKINGTV